MNKINKQEFEEANVYFIDNGLLIESTIDSSNYSSRKANYDFPITIVVNKTFGVQIIHGLHVYQFSESVAMENYAFNRGIVMMNKLYNWIIFIPNRRYDLDVSEGIVLSEIQKFLNQQLNLYGFPEQGIYPDYNLNNPCTSFSYGMGVE